MKAPSSDPLGEFGESTRETGDMRLTLGTEMLEVIIFVILFYILTLVLACAIF